MEDGHIKTVDETLNYFGTDPERGLSLDQIKRNQEKYGPNGEYKFHLFSAENRKKVAEMTINAVIFIKCKFPQM